MEITENDALVIPLPDGTRLSARLWRPASGAPVPAILEYIPYRKRDNTLPRDEAIHPWMAAQGYACLRVDIRGAGDSEGVFEDEYSEQELRDACDVIAWIAAQDWCDGAVGMMGKSWGAFNCLQTAARNPPALKAVIKVCGTVDRFNDDIHYKGGCLLGENFGWATLMMSYNARPADPLLREDWREDFRQRIETMPFLAEVWTEHQSRDAYWKHGSVCEDYAAINAAVLSIGGWNDNYMNAPAALVKNAKVAKAIVGPWVHQYPHMAVPAPRIDFLNEMKNWWDRWLKGIKNGAEDLPDYRVYMLDSEPPNACAASRKGRWLADASPSPYVTETPLSLGADGRLGGAWGVERVIATPQTLGANSAEFYPMGLAGEMAGDQSADDAHSVCFEMDCPEGLALMGAAELDLQLTPDATHGFVVARICDVAPDGSSVRIAHGVLNLHHRIDPPEPLTPGKTYDVTLTLDQMAYRLAPGHRLRLALSNSYWPFIWPSPESVSLRLTGGELRLPVHSDEAPLYHFDDAPPLPDPSLTTITAPFDRRERRIDMISGAEQMIVTADMGRMVNPAHGLETHSALQEVWSIHPDDPLCAACTITWDQEFRRGDWSVVTHVSATQTGDRDNLTVTGELIATLTEAQTTPEVIKRNFIAHVARKHV
ncbi:CocE/NonD family hydrolase [Pararhodobacter oceanensis]|uniref:CocE/NonD family hydrolase n=1 Tax=Pararhodobacter oceanensis TaxID=2172121 RepID=UPI003A8DCDCA